MRLNGVWRRSAEELPSGGLRVLDQRRLPFEVLDISLETESDCARAIRSMEVRGAPLIGIVAAYGLVFALQEDPSDGNLEGAFHRLMETRPTAVNLAWALRAVRTSVQTAPLSERAGGARATARILADADAAACEAIGRHGLALFRELHARANGARSVLGNADAPKASAGRGRNTRRISTRPSDDLGRFRVSQHPPRPLQILTHCNAGWLATVDWGTALAPIYMAHDAGIPVHVWVDETRPRNQGLLTAFELRSHGVPCTFIADNAGGHLMQRGEVDVCIVGCDRVTRRGDACNKIGTYLKALAAQAHGVPFYVAMPWSTYDSKLVDGVREIPIEDRSGDEVRAVSGLDDRGLMATVHLVPPGQAVQNPAFDVTPAALVAGFITERGIFAAADLAAEGERLEEPDGRSG